MRHLLALISILLAANAYCGSGSWTRRVPFKDIANTGYSVYEPQLSAGEDLRKFNAYKAFVRLNYSRKDFTDRTHGYDWTVTVNFSYISGGSTVNSSLVINNFKKLEDYLELPVAAGANGYSIKITSVTGAYGTLGSGATATTVPTPQTSSFIPADIDLTLELRAERVYELNKSTSVNTDQCYLKFDPATFRLNWNYLQGAEYYDVEWVFIDAYSKEYDQLALVEALYTPNELVPFEYPFQLMEPARVRVRGHSYDIDKTFPEGQLYFRVRPVSVFADQNGITDYIRTGKWGSATSFAGAVCKFEVTASGEFEANQTWLFGIQYSEDGKSVSTTSFYDGSNRGRQSLSYNTSDDVTLVGETKYDQEGRQTVSVIPAPVAGRTLNYKPMFNLAGSGNIFDENEIETGTIPALSTLSGSAKYFSKDNNLTTDLFRDAIPDAGGYVFSQTIYRNDNSGRIDRAGGIGADFQATGSHASRMFYGTPTAAELKRLFGNNVPNDPDGYRKDMVKDANGQYSVTYYDKRGNTIATALAGDSPTSLRKLDYAEETLETPLNDNNVRVGNSLVSEHTFLNTIPNQNVTFNYNMTGVVSQLNAQVVVVDNAAIPFGEFCAACSYTLKIIVKDANGVIVGAPHEASIPAGGNCTAASYASGNFSITLPDAGEYRIIKALSIDEEAMTTAFQAQITAQQDTTYETFLDEYLQNVDVTACFTDCNDWCYYTAQLDYNNQHGEGTWNSLTKSQQNALVAACTSTACDLNTVLTNDPITVDNASACETQRQRMLHQLAPGADISTHREYCMLQNGRCEQWMAVYNSSTSFTMQAMQATWGNTGIFATPYSSTYDAANNMFLMSSQLTLRVNNYASLYPLSISGTGCMSSASLSSGGLYSYVNLLINKYAELQACNGVAMSATDIEIMKKQVFIGIYLKLKWQLVRELAGCTFYDDEDAVFLIPQENKIYTMVEDAFESAQTKTCQEVAIDKMNLWMAMLPADCTDAAGMALFLPVEYISTEATALENKYITPSGTPSLAQLFYNFVRATCDNSNNKFGVFYDPDLSSTVTEPGEAEYDAIRTLLMSFAACSEAFAGTGQLPFEETYSPNNDPILGSTVTEADLLAAINEIVNYGFDNLGTNSLVGFMTFGQAPLHQLPSHQLSTYLYDISLGNGFDGYFSATQFGNGGISPYPHDIRVSVEKGGCFYSFQIPFWVVNWHFPYYYDTPAYLDYIADNTEDFFDFKLTPHYLAGTFVEYKHCAPGYYYYNTNYFYDCNWNGLAVLTKTCAGAGSSTGVPPLPGMGEEFTANPAVTDCIESQILQAQADAQVAYNDAIEDLWSQFYASMDNCLNVTENFKMTYKLKEYQYMLYFHDLAGNLVQTVPPQGVKPLTPTETNKFFDGIAGNESPLYPAHEMETVYKYNGMNAVTASFTPDGGMEQLFLDKLYRVKYALKPAHHPKFIKYDELGRVTEAGEMRLIYSGDPAVYLDLLVKETPSYTDGMYLDYTHTFYEDAYYKPGATLNNPYDPAIAIVRDNSLTTAMGAQDNLRNAIGAVMHRQADYDVNGNVLAGTEVISVISYSYDAHKNVKRMVTTNNHLTLTGFQHKATDYRYDLLSGNVEEVIYQDNAWDEYHHYYHYDANNRLVRSFTSHNGDYMEMDAKYFYYLHGPLARKELGHDKLQGTDYAYNLQGWLKGVNSSTLDRTRDIGKDAGTGDNQYFGLDAMGFMLGYFENDYKAIKDAAEGTDNVLNNYFAVTTGVSSQNVNPDFSSSAMGSLYNGNITHMVTALRDYSENKLDILANNYQYDQLQRIRQVKAYSLTQSALQSANSFAGAGLYRTAGGQSAYQEDYTFDKNGNILTLKRNGSGLSDLGATVALPMDDFTYYYESGTGGFTTNPVKKNLLAAVKDNLSSDPYSGDIANTQSTTLGNYFYNAAGELVKDVDEHIVTGAGPTYGDGIEWTTTGKVKKMHFNNGKYGVKFIYDALDRRIAKQVYKETSGVDNNSDISWTYYSYDASGNVMATYNRIKKFDYVSGSYNYYVDNLKLGDHYIYGAERLGTETENIDLSTRIFRQPVSAGSLDVENPISWQSVQIIAHTAPDYTNRVIGDKSFELANHLGNVLAVISDRKLRYTDNGTVVYTADVISYSDYSPYGTQLHKRFGTQSGTIYRYAFQSQERDDEIKGPGNSYNYEYRMHDPRIGRFFAIDPLAPKYPKWSPYAFSGNQVIHTVELEGLEPAIDISVANPDKTYQGSDKSSNTSEIIFNWSVNVSSNGSRTWIMGNEYTGANTEEATYIANHSYNLHKSSYSSGGKNEAVNNTEYTLLKKYTSTSKSTGYKAGLYYRRIEGVTFYCFATAGTDDLNDAATDVKQVLGDLEAQLAQSIVDAKRINNWVGGLNNGNHLTFVGHSLGGGLAAANALATGRNAITFNAMGLSNTSKYFYSLYKAAQIDAYIIRGEAVDYAQKLCGLALADGTRHYVDAKDGTMSFDSWEFLNGSDYGIYSSMYNTSRYKAYVLKDRIRLHSLDRFLNLYK